MRRGDIITVAISGDYGKPRPAVVIQSDALGESESVLIVPFTTTLRDAPFYRLTIEPSDATGLKAVSQIMVDKVRHARARNAVRCWPWATFSRS